MKNDSKIKKRIFSRVLVISLTALLFSCALIAIANDVYAFIKKDSEVILTVSEPQTLNELSLILEENGIIENPTAFSIYVRSKNKEDIISGFCGEISLNSSMSYREILSCFADY